MSAIIKAGAIDGDRFDRSRRIKWIDMEKIESARCFVAGAGALGNEVIKNLVLSGVRSITLVDMDFIVRSNLNRCVLFREEDTLKKTMKADVIAKRAKELNPGIDITPVNSRIEEIDSSCLKNHDVVFGCLDNIGARMHLNAYAYFYGVPYIDGGTDGTTGKIQVVLPPDTPCLQCTTNKTHARILEKRFSCTGQDISIYEPKIPAEITTTSIIAAIQVREGLKILSGKKEYCIRHVCYYNGFLNTFDSFEVSLDPMCPVHLSKFSKSVHPYSHS
ncbi:MAG: ThiF family adenylyltransferase [Methanomassiliicoccales archaeon]|jgi:molybdopterin/thiamine biosynthesis adenylyltransferase|nr:ThiF family adenylyltransferase [Methanomassiliicoccales archaeon]